LADAAERSGAKINLSSTVTEVEIASPHRVSFEREGRVETVEADHVWSTIPITVLAKIAGPTAPADVVEASRRLSYRAMVLIYLVLEQPQWTEYDAHYFPESEIKLTRLSEPKNYSDSADPQDRTVLCGELPCTVGDEVWNASDDELGEMVKEALSRCGLPIKSNVAEVATKRLPFAYPIYHEGYEKNFEIQDAWADGLERVLTFGRQGLFAHDNTHHALAMAYAAVECLSAGGEFDKSKWAEFRAEFSKHVVED
jgi:protoporphyrinogen oxidase